MRRDPIVTMAGSVVHVVAMQPGRLGYATTRCGLQIGNARAMIAARELQRTRPCKRCDPSEVTHGS